MSTPNKKLVAYQKVIKIVIKGKALPSRDEKDGNEPYLPNSFFEYIRFQPFFVSKSRSDAGYADRRCQTIPAAGRST